jgi:hypothetical protein
MVVLDLLQDGQQPARPTGLPGEDLVDELPIQTRRPLR